MRFQSYTARDTTDATDGDTAWQGINMTLDKPTVPQGFLSRGENTRLRYGKVSQRKGTTIPADFNPAAGLSNYIVGTGLFRNPNGDEVLMVAPAGVTYTLAFQYGKDALQIPYETAVTVPPTAPTGNNGTVAVEFVQGFHNLIMLRRPLGAAESLVWDGTAAGKWKIMNLSPEGLKPIPYMWHGEPFMDRIIYYNANAATAPQRDSWIMSDVEDYSSYDNIFQSFRTNPGESDYITRILAYFRESALIFKNQSIHQATLLNTYPVTIQQRILSPHLGNIGNRMPVVIGADVMFASQGNGFYRLAEVIQEQITAQPVPISEPIQRVVDAINWRTVGFYGCAVALENYAFFGVCIGGGNRLNAVLVYDTQRRQWESAGDTWRDPSFGFSKLELTNYNGVQRIFAIDDLGGIIYLLYEGVNDELYSGSFSVPFKMETRGYVGDSPIAFKRFGRASVSIATYDPLLTITAISDGFNEEKVIGEITKDRDVFYQHGHPRFDFNTSDPDEQKRLDYSITNPDNFAGQDFEDLPVGPLFFLPGTSPPVAGDKQESLERLLVRNFGRWNALRIENDQGACDILGVSIESTPAMNTGLTAA